MPDKNVFGGDLLACSYAPLSGFFRDGCCRTGADDLGTHMVRARVTAAFLQFSLERGNDLMTPRPEYRFAGLQAGDRWCLCALRWVEALEAAVAPPVVLEATHERVLKMVDLDVLRKHAYAATSP